MLRENKNQVQQNPMEDSLTRDLGPQPLDALLDEIGLSNHQLVALSTEQLTHKQVQKARKGKRISVNIQRKILRALNARPVAPAPVAPEGEGDAEEEPVAPEKKLYELKELFNYRG
jgi:hypothetical protein